MLASFLLANRAAIVDRANAQLLRRAAPAPTDQEMREGIPLFLDQIGEALLRAESGGAREGAAMMRTATRHGEALHRIGLTVGQVVQDYGDVCQSITELAVQQHAPISSEDFQTLNHCLDEAISGAVTSYAQTREKEITEQSNERIGILAHEMRNYLHTAMVTFESIRRGLVPIGGSTGRILQHSLQDLQAVINRSLAEVRLESGHIGSGTILVREFLGEAEISATIDARERGVNFVVKRPEDRDLSVRGDRQLLAGALANLLQNALKFTPAGGTVTLTAGVKQDRVHIRVEDQCGGISQDKLKAIFEPFEQAGSDRGGLGLGLVISRKAAEANGGTLSVRNVDGKGCIFTLDLPRMVPSR